MQYIFIGSVSKNTALIESEEGSLSWISYKNILKNNVTATTREIVKHHKETGKYDDKIYVGSMRSLKGDPGITWALLEDWELPILN